MGYPTYGSGGVPAAYLEPQQWIPDPSYQGGGYYAHYGGKGVHFTQPQLEELWDRAGGPRAAAPAMAAIAEQVESAGWTDAWNSSGATGLWQVEYPSSAPPGMSREQLFTPAGNAAAAVRLYRQGGYSAWGSDLSQVTLPPNAPASKLPAGFRGLPDPGQANIGIAPGLPTISQGGLGQILTRIAVLAPVLLAAAAIGVLGLFRMTQPARQRLEDRATERAGQAASIAAVA